MAGLTQEVEDIFQRVRLPIACQQCIPIQKVLVQIKLSSLKKVKEDMQGLVKLDKVKNEDMRKPQEYMKTLCLEDARLEFRFRT